jgi:hypothetical protein
LPFISLSRYMIQLVRFAALPRVARILFFWVLFINCFFFRFHPPTFVLLGIDHCYFFQFVFHEIGQVAQPSLTVCHATSDWLEAFYFIICFFNFYLFNIWLS